MRTGIYQVGLLLGMGIAILSGCSDEESMGKSMEESTIPVYLTITEGTRTPNDTDVSVNRVLILPFRKIDEGLPDSLEYFVPEYSSARQMDVSPFPAVATMLNLSASSTYRMIIVGYNQSDFNFTDTSGVLQKFSIMSTATPATMKNMYLKPTDVANVPEFFSCAGIGYKGQNMVGQAFKPMQINSIKGELRRIVSGLNLQIRNIPGYVKSMTLMAERTVTGIRATDAEPMTWRTETKVLETKTSVQKNVDFSLFMLPTGTERSTLLYLDVTYGDAFTERYTVNISDKAGVVSGNKITFVPNQWVKITGDYSALNIGFTLDNEINLDDNAWDGIQQQ